MTPRVPSNPQGAIASSITFAALVVVAFLLHQTVDSVSVARQRELSELSELRASTCDGSQGEHVIATGTVVKADGSPCPGSFVAISTSRRTDSGIVRTDHTATVDSEGRFAIRADFVRPGTDMLVALSPDGRLGLRWFPTHRAAESLTVKLMPGRAVLHVVDLNGRPISGAIVDVHETGIDDLSEPLPLSIRRRLRRRTDRDGKVEYPSRLGDHPLGFTVYVRGVEQASTNFTGYNRSHLFVFGGTYEDQYRLQEVLEDRLANTMSGE